MFDVLFALFLNFRILLFSDKDEFCEWESFNATCRRDEVVIMKAAKYGRMRLGKCVTKNYGHIGCGTDVMPYMEERCSGRMSCLVSVISLHNKRSCPKDFKSYLQASYECLEGGSPLDYDTLLAPVSYYQRSLFHMA